MSKRVQISEQQAAVIARAVAEPRRMDILRQVGQCEGCTPCSAVQANHAVSAATLSHHVSELTEAGLIDVRREGKFAFLSLRRDVWGAYLRYLQEI